MSPDAAEPGKRPACLLLTCEHGGREVPPGYDRLFIGAEAVLATHRGYDIGALDVALRIASRLAAPIVFSTTTRLLIDLNRSLGTDSLFSEFSRSLPDHERDRLVRQHYLPYRANVTAAISGLIAMGFSVIHVGIHSFTDVLNGVSRELDIALLFDESRPAEKAFCRRWQAVLRARSGALRHRFNEPYRGCDDGLTTSLRRQFASDHYLGIEVEIRQGLLGSTPARSDMGNRLSEALAEALAE